MLVPPPILRPDTLKGIDTLIRADFIAFRETCFNWLLVATGLVVIGLVFEGPELWHEISSITQHWRFRRRFHFSVPEDHMPSWAKLLAFVGWLFIVMGVAGEYVADSFVSRADGYVQTFDEILLTETQTRTALASERASAAYERASENEKETAETLKQAQQERADAAKSLEVTKGYESQIAEAQRNAAESKKESARLIKEAEAEHLARVKMEAAVAWRQLSDQDKRDIGAALTGFKSLAAVGIWFNSSSTEDELFADDIAEALRAGGIVTNAPGGIMEMRESSGKFGEPIAKATTGVRVQSTKDDTARRFATAFIAELNRRGFDADRQKDPPFGESKIPQIWVTVEPRPKGPQGEYKLQVEAEAKITSANKSKH